jgi:hypothetical protein
VCEASHDGFLPALCSGYAASVCTT